LEAQLQLLKEEYLALIMRDGELMQQMCQCAEIDAHSANDEGQGRLAVDMKGVRLQLEAVKAPHHR
jgi:hypothetical protein